MQTIRSVFAFVLLAFSFVSPEVRAENQSSRLNVLFIAIDDLKPALGCYAAEGVFTPSMDQLAKQSTVFSKAYCQFPVCGGSRASFMTGLRPESVGVMDLKTSMRAKNPDVVTLPQHFRHSGYNTAAVGKIYDPRCVGDPHAYDAASWTLPYIPVANKILKNDKTKQVTTVSEFADEELADGWIRKEAIARLRELHSKGKPFFLAVGFKKPHLPFVAPKKYWELYDPSKIQLANHSGSIANASGYSLHESSEYRGYEGVPKDGPFPAELQRHSIHGYMACVSYIDTQVGMLLDELNELGLQEKTIVVLLSDHGFHLGDHGMWGKHSTLENATQVPLMIRMPGISGNVCASPTELCDLYPTLADLCGLDAPVVDGRSLKPVLTQSGPAPREGALTVFKSRGSIGYSFRTERYRYTEWINPQAKIVAKELFDYELDPFEKVNFADDPKLAETQAVLANQLRSHAEGCIRLSSEVNQNRKTAIPLRTVVPVSTSTLRTEASDDDQKKATIRSISNAENSFPILVGAASNAKFWDTETYEILNREFAYVTPGNDFKQSAIHPQPGKWKWQVADQWIDRCQKNGQVMRLHSAISPQCSKWAKSDERTGDELKTNLTEYMTAICKRFNGKPHVKWMDVVNETVSRNGEWFGPKPGNESWENPWPAIGIDESHSLKPPAYIKLAFEIADRHAPDIKLIFNQHGGMEPAMWDKVKATIQYLQDAGVRVDGVGWQGHIDTGFETDPANIKQLRSLIEWAHSRKLEFHVTEFNAWIKKKNKSDPVTEADLKAQATTYREVLRIVSGYSHTGTVTWCAWQIKDNETERGHFRGNLFDAEGNPKPAFDAVLSELQLLKSKQKK